jgi:nitroreductase
MADYNAEPHDRFGPGEPGGDTDAPESAFLRQVLRRRTHRSYARRPVPPALVRMHCLAALSASSKSDFQQTSIIEVTDPQSRATLAEPFPEMPHIGTSPVFLVFFGDARRLERISTLRDHPQRNGNLEGFFNAAVDTTQARQTCILAAESVGLGRCPISVLRNHALMVGEVPHLPEMVFPVVGLCLGWPAAQGFVSMRLPPAITVHRDRYDDTHLPEQIDAYDRARDARFSVPRDKQRAFLVHFDRDYAGFNRVYASCFPSDRLPGRPTIRVTALARGGIVEIDMIARR